MSKYSILKRLGDIFQKPFREHFLFLIAFFVLATSPYFIWQFYVQKIYLNASCLAIHCFIVSYLVTLFIGLIQVATIRKVVQGILILLACTNFAINFYCIFELGYLLDADIAMLILGTDINEAKEFASVLLPKWIILTVGGVFLLFLFLWYISRHHKLNLGKKTSWLAMVGLVLCIAINSYTWEVWAEGPIYRLYEMTQYEVTDNLQSYYTHPKVTFVDQELTPSNVVLIIGESFARCHSSLYDYEKDTNPHLAALRDSSLLFAFDNVDSPAPTTAESIRFMLSTYSKADDTSKNLKKWFEYTTIIELMEDCGFECVWFGNQARGSKKNGAARVFAEACNQQWFLQQEGSDDFNVKPDEILVNSSYQYAHQINPQERHFIIYHMMGSHFNYSMRYPKEFAKFSEKDYPTEPQSHRTTLASYDNSILYNDYVVWQIINLYKDQETVVIYLPDHGQVMFRDKNYPDHFAHGKVGDSINYAYGIDIPFIIYASPLFQQKHSGIMQRIKDNQAKSKTWNSDDLPYLILDLIGAKTINGEDIQPKSLLN